MKAKLENIESHLKSRILGQDHVVPRVASVLRRGEFGLASTSRPKGSFIFLGPTGVGKTELTLTFTQYLFEDDLLFRFDMSEYMHFDSIKLFLGDEYGHPGRLTGILDKHSKGTLLFDEMEKSHPQILLLFLQMLDAARITLSNGKTYDLSQFYIVFTSNIGSDKIAHFKHSKLVTLERAILKQLESELRPEFYARIDEKLVFGKLGYGVQRDIAKINLDSELNRLKALGYDLSYENNVLEFLIRRGIDDKHGARPLRNTISRFVQDAIVHGLLIGNSNGTLSLDEINQKLTIC